MGCDIHGIVEIRWHDKWIGLGTFGTRDYWMFAHLADVRNEGRHVYKNILTQLEEVEPKDEGVLAAITKTKGLLADQITPISEPRGLPTDASDLIRYYAERMGSDGHSHSWVSFDEMIGLLDKAIPLAYRESIKTDEELVRIYEKHFKDDKTVPVPAKTTPEFNRFKWQWLETWLGSASDYYTYSDTDEYSKKEREFASKNIRFTFFFDN